jgi:hypothetical protein
MQGNIDYNSFRLSSGGLFHSLLQRLHIQQPGRYSLRRRNVVLIILCWLPLLLLSMIEGNLFNAAIELPFVYDPTPYIRYLVVLPMLVNADLIVDKLITSMLQSLRASGILGDDNEGLYCQYVEKLSHRKDSAIADIIIIVISYGMVLVLLANVDQLAVGTGFSNWMTNEGGNGPELTAAGWWLLLVSSPVLQIIMYRWFWRFYLWCEFLFRVSRLKLVLQPTHPDLAGGLGILRNSESAFILIALAFGALLSVGLAEDIMHTDTTLKQTVPAIATYIILAIIIMSLPMTFFTRQLLEARRWGRVVYGDLGYRLSKAFDKKWGDPLDQSSGVELLKTADSSTVCDYADIYDVVNNMRFAPLSLKGYIRQVIMLAFPFVPLILTEYSLQDIVKRILTTVV